MPRPLNLDAFMEPPSLEEWNSELADGWGGSDGSSCSPDDVLGVRIGVTSRSFRYSGLPANRHDWRYRIGRRYGLPEAWRKAADAEYRDGCVEHTDAALVGWRRRLARLLARNRYFVLRLLGRSAWTKEPALPDPR